MGTSASRLITLCCPYCKGALDSGDSANWRCLGCDRRFPADGDIPDLRIFETFHGSRERERPMVQTLLAAYPTGSFADLVKLRFGSNLTLPKSLRAKYTVYRLQNVDRGAARMVQTQAFLARAGKTLPEQGAALEIGCGSGGTLISLARRFSPVAGIDINMADLILAKKLAEEQGLTNIVLACACAEALPFEPNAFSFVEALDVIEHVESQPKTVAEGYRVLAQGGVFWFSCPNRFYLYGPEPHVWVWGVGFLPRRWQNAYVKLVKHTEYRGKRLLSRAELTRLVRAAHISEFAIVDPDQKVDLAPPPRSQLGRMLRRAAPWLVNVVNWSTRYLGDEFRIIVSK